MENACKSCSLGIVLLFACATFAYVNHTATFKPKFRSTDGKLLEYIVKIISNHVENGRYKRSDGVTNGTQFQVPVADSMTSTRGDNINNNTVDLNHLYNNSNEYEITKNFSNLNCSEFVVNKTERYFCESETDNQTRNSVNPLKALQLPENEDRGISNRNGVILVEEKSSNHVNSKDNKEYHTCRRSARCEPLNHTMCFGATLYYKQTSLSLVNSTANQNEIQEQLQKWNSLRSVPKCWALIQTLLCSVYMPRCDNGMVDLPSHEMCRVTRYPCRIVESTLGWPDFLKCGYEKNFPSLCKVRNV